MSAGAGVEAPAIFTPEYYRRMRELEASGWWNAGMRDAASSLLDLVQLPRAGTLLDVGCGSGQTLAWFRARRPEWNVLGIDVALDGLRAGRALGEAVSAASALDLPVRDHSVDLVVTLDVLQHLPLDGGDRHALAEIRRALRPGGHLLVRTNAQAFPVTPDDPDYNFHKYAAAELGRKLDEAGFEVLRLSRINALLGLAEIPREMKANRRAGRRYHGILARPAARSGLADRFKRQWLALEGRAVARGWTLPSGRTLIALCRS
jgi:SAM-dependent methyltransferase